MALYETLKGYVAAHFFSDRGADLLQTVKVGDEVTQWVAGIIAISKTVSEISDTIIACGGCVFDRATGAEIVKDSSGGPPPLLTGSFITVSSEPPVFMKQDEISIMQGKMIDKAYEKRFAVGKQNPNN